MKGVVVLGNVGSEMSEMSLRALSKNQKEGKTQRSSEKAYLSLSCVEGGI